jgi:hypothetical protein
MSEPSDTSATGGKGVMRTPAGSPPPRTEPRDVDETSASIPEPIGSRATCAWCRLDFASIIDLLDHVEAGHADVLAEARPHAASEIYNA